MERDLAALAAARRRRAAAHPVRQGVRSGEMLAQFAQSLRAELDFRREADAMAEMALLLGAGTRPCASRRSTASSARGGSSCRSGSTASPSPTPRQLDASGIDRTALADQLLRSTLDQVLRVGFFHADPHPGNVFAFADGTLGLIDFGAVGRLDPIQQAAVVDMLAGARATRRRACCATASSGSPT